MKSHPIEQHCDDVNKHIQFDIHYTTTILLTAQYGMLEICNIITIHTEKLAKPYGIQCGLIQIGVEVFGSPLRFSYSTIIIENRMKKNAIFHSTVKSFHID